MTLPLRKFDQTMGTVGIFSNGWRNTQNTAFALAIMGVDVLLIMTFAAWRFERCFWKDVK
jgi:hypothetical protein